MADEIQNTENAEIEETPDETPAEDVVEETAPESEEPVGRAPSRAERKALRAGNQPVPPPRRSEMLRSGA